MTKQIISKYDGELEAIIVRMTDNISLSALEEWQENFLELVHERSGSKKLAVLLDTNKHQFESIECLKLLHNLFSNNLQFKRSVSRVAFVSPRQYREPEVVSQMEGYFENMMTHTIGCSGN